MKQRIISLLERAKENGTTIGDVLAEVRGISDGWQPIGTAPKDGSEIWGFNGEQARMLCSEGEHWALWVWADSSLADIDPSPDQPTHWMPIPAAPGADNPASRPALPAADERAQVVDLRTPANMAVNGGALQLALNVLRRAGKHEVAKELEKTAQPVADGRDALDAARYQWLRSLESVREHDDWTIYDGDGNAARGEALDAAIDAAIAAQQGEGGGV